MNADTTDTRVFDYLILASDKCSEVSSCLQNAITTKNYEKVRDRAVRLRGDAVGGNNSVRKPWV
jgi:hypothetical protein